MAIFIGVYPVNFLCTYLLILMFLCLFSVCFVDLLLFLLMIMHVLLVCNVFIYRCLSHSLMMSSCTDAYPFLCYQLLLLFIFLYCDDTFVLRFNVFILPGNYSSICQVSVYFLMTMTF